MKAKVAQRDGEAGSPIAGAGIGTWKKERVEILSLGLWGSIIQWTQKITILGLTDARILWNVGEAVGVDEGGEQMSCRL